MTETGIKSFGIIVYTNSPEFRLLLYQRRDSYDYIDLIRGQWKTRERANELYNRLCDSEKTRILTHTFDDLWTDLWIYPRVQDKTYQDAKKKFQVLLSNLSTPQRVTHLSPPWSFPKGKKHNNESAINCALRELKEETGINPKYLNIIDVGPCKEITYDDKGMMYLTYYYLARVDRELPIKRKLTNHCIRKDTVSNEASDVRWMTYDEARLVLDASKCQILRSVYHHLQCNINTILDA